MKHRDHVKLIEKGISQKEGVWADLGSGTGAFTLALRDIVGPKSTLYSVDMELGSLEEQNEQIRTKFPDTEINYLNEDFTLPMPLPKLDGILMANSIHYIEDKVFFLRQLKRYLKPNGRLVVVEYNVDNGNQWVPYPISFGSFQKIAQKSGFSQPKFLHKIPSQFLNEIYSAVATNL